MQKIVITGNIGSGKSTIVKIFQSYNVPLFDADRFIGDIYNHDSKFKQDLYALNPEFIVNDRVSKPVIIDYLQKNPDFITTLEGVLYPILQIKRQEFIDTQTQLRQKMVIFEVPLLFEKKMEHLYDYIILVYAPYDIRLKRALGRENMSVEKFNFMNNRQINYVDLLPSVDLGIDTTQSFDVCKKIITNRFFV